MANNVLLNRTLTASSFVAPYAPSRVVDGVINQPTNRWLCRQLPGWIQADLGANLYVDRWVVRMLPNAGWPSPSFSLSNFSLQGSIDGQNWYTIDSVAGNTAAIVDRTFAAATLRFVRIIVTGGMLVNTQLASLLEWELYESPQTSNNLISLTTSSGALQPPFTSNAANYAENIGYDVDSITVTPTSEDPQAVVKVNGIVVARGAASQSISLADGLATPIPVEVTPVRGNAKIYNLSVTRASSPYLSALQVFVGRNPQTLQPAFVQGEYSYQCAVASSASNATFKPTAQDTTAAILVNGVAVTNATSGVTVPLTEASTTVTVQISSSKGQDQRTYSIIVNKTT